MVTDEPGDGPGGAGQTLRQRHAPAALAAGAAAATIRCACSTVLAGTPGRLAGTPYAGMYAVERPPGALGWSRCAMRP